MINARVFAQHLHSQDIQFSNARLLIANYFYRFVDSEAKFETDLLNDFYLFALEFEYWREHAKGLELELKRQIDSFMRYQKNSIDLKKLISPSEVQIFKIHRKEDFSKLMAKYAEKNETQDFYFKHFSNSNILTQLFSNGDVTVRQLPQLAYLIDDELTPFPGLQLHYDPQLQLKKHCTQFLRIDEFRSFAFQMQENRVEAKFFEGYRYHMQRRFESNLIHKIKELFIPLKRLESSFIENSGNPFYQTTTLRLKRSIELLQKSPEENMELALSSYEQGRIVAEQVFSNDKTLICLIKKLGNQLTEALQKQESTSRDISWPKQNERRPLQAQEYD